MGECGASKLDVLQSGDVAERLSQAFEADIRTSALWPVAIQENENVWQNAGMAYGERSN